MNLAKKFLSWRKKKRGRAESDVVGPSEGIPVISLQSYLLSLQKNKDLPKSLDPPSNEISHSLEILQQLGRGHFGSVFSGYYQGRQVAIKRLQTLGSNLEIQHLQEIIILKYSSVSHPNIPKFYGSFVSESTAQVYLVMDLVEGYPLSKICGAPPKHVGPPEGESDNRGASEELTVTDKLYFSWQLWCGLNYLHSKLICHIDIKPDNIMIPWDKCRSPKLVDFGLSRYETNIDDSRGWDAQNGTVLYWPPEKPIMARESPGKGDVWSLGVSLCEFYAQQYPFLVHGEKPTRQDQIFGFYKLLDSRPCLTTLGFWDKMQYDCFRELTATALVYDYRERPNARSMEEAGYKHLRDSLSAHSVDNVSQHLQRHFTMRQLKKRQRKLNDDDSSERSISPETCDSGKGSLRSTTSKGSRASSRRYDESPVRNIRQRKKMLREEESERDLIPPSYSDASSYTRDDASLCLTEETTTGCWGRCLLKRGHSPNYSLNQ